MVRTLGRIADISTPSRWRVWSLALLTPLVAAGGAFVALDFQAHRGDVLREARLQAAAATGALLTYVRETAGQADALAQAWVVIGGDRPGVEEEGVVSADPLLEAFVAGRRRIVEATIVQNSGEIVAASRDFRRGEAVEVGGLLPAGGLQGATVTGLYLGTGTEAASVVFLAGAGQGSGEALLLRMPLDRLATLALTPGVIPESATITAYDQYGHVLYARMAGGRTQGMRVGDDASGTALWREGRAAAEGRWTGRDAGGVQRVVFFEALEHAPWVLAVGFDEGELFQSVWSRLYVRLGSLVAVAVAVAWMMQAFIRRERRVGRARRSC